MDADLRRQENFISDWPSNSGSTQDVICDNTATLMASRGYAVTRVPAYSMGGVHYTFTNMVICNSVVLLPQYNGERAIEPWRFYRRRQFSGR